MARFQVRGAVLGVRTTPYDFEDSEGKRQQGESLTVVLFDESSVSASEIKVQRKAAGKFTEIPMGTVVEVAVDVFANSDAAGRPLLSISAADVRAA